MSIAGRDPMDYDDVWGDTENFPAHMVNPPKEYRQPIRPAAVVAGGVLFGAVAVCALVIIAWATGWMADEITRVLP